MQLIKFLGAITLMAGIAAALSAPAVPKLADLEAHEDSSTGGGGSGTGGGTGGQGGGSGGGKSTNAGEFLTATGTHQ